MTRRICLDSMLTEEFPSCSFDDAVVVLDTNAHRYKYKETDRKIVVTSGVLNELPKYPHVFPDEAIYSLALLLNPRVVHHFIEPRHEEMILRVTSRVRKKGRIGNDIGWVDTQQIGYCLNVAETGRVAVLVSNDSDILLTARELRKEYDFAMNNFKTVSVRHYIERKNAEFLKGHKGLFRKALISEVEGLYRYTA